MTVSIAVTAGNSSLQDRAKQLAIQLNLPFVISAQQEYQYLLVLTELHLELQVNQPKPPKPLYVDFIFGQMGHRIKYGGGKGQLIARAVGLQKRKNIRVLDVTAGLGRDAFILATLGCQVTMLERSKIIAALLQDGLLRARALDWVKQLSINLIIADAQEYLLSLASNALPQVIYIDPMFPETKKSALVKKEMRILRDIVGADPDAEQLLSLALDKATQRVVVKRARLAPSIAGHEPSIKISGKSSRYDIYLI